MNTDKHGLKNKPNMNISAVLRTKQEAKENYNKISRWYDIFSLPERKYIEIGLQRLNAKEKERILEIGFGTGNSIIELAKSVGNQGKVYGVDISETMNQITKSKIEKAGLSDRVFLKCEDATKQPFKNDFLDGIFMSFTLELFDLPEIPIVLNECNRVLKPKGRISIVAMSRPEKLNIVTKIYEWSHRKFPKYIDCRPIQVKQSVEDAGFQIIDSAEMMMWGLPVAIVLANKIK